MIKNAPGLTTRIMTELPEIVGVKTAKFTCGIVKI
jgi:hypothetical protein